jgi:dihydropteroate synthase
VDEKAVPILRDKLRFRNIKLRGISLPAANILKQSMLSVGGDVAVSKEVVKGGVERSDVIIAGTVRQIERLCESIKQQPFGLSEIAKQLELLLQRVECPPSPMLIGGKEFSFGNRTYVMGVLNVTPDSFSDGGLYMKTEDAILKVREMVSCGVDILDVGGESTRPGSSPVSSEEELRRVLPVLKLIRNEFDIPVSVDTYKSEVSEKAIEAGASMINDVSGFRFDRNLPRVVAEGGVAVCLVHSRRRPADMQKDVSYDSLMDEVYEELNRSIDVAVEAGVNYERVIIDPGIGFAKEVDDNLELLLRLEELRSFGRPIVVGTSRKSFIGKVLHKDVGDRLMGTAATVAVSIMNGADFIRVHDVDEMIQVARMTDSIKYLFKA